MFFDLDLMGDTLPPKTLCLTYDDGPGQTEGSGPGPKTAEIGQFLADRGIAATFFVVGDQVRANPGIVARLRAGGHIVANHTDTHPTLVSFVRDQGDVVVELARADESIGSPTASGDLTFFRAPYGDWRHNPDPDDSTIAGSTSPVAEILNADGRFPHLVGPVGWDIDAADWNCWRVGTSAEECGQLYLTAIEQAGRGIILLHDSSESPAIRDNNLTFELTQWLVPILEERGYRFVRLDQVPGVRSAGRVTRQVTFEASPGHWLSCPADSTRIELRAVAHRSGGRERFGVVPIEAREEREIVALRAWNGSYLVASASGAIVAAGREIDESTRWSLDPDSSGRVTLRSPHAGSIVAADAAGALCLQTDTADPIRFEVATLVEVAPLGA